MKAIIKHLAIFAILVIIFPTSCKNDDSNPNPEPEFGTFTDPRDNQVYTTVEICTQTWFAQNLNYATDSDSWVYNDDPSNDEIYGRLYTWEMAKTVCPDGWHLPDVDEWSTLVYDYLGGFEIAGGKLKATDTVYWKSPNFGATNESGFTALPGGHYSFGESFYSLGKIATFWSSVEKDSFTAYKYDLTYKSTQIYTDPDYKSAGKSVRCVKDE